MSVGRELRHGGGRGNEPGDKNTFEFSGMCGQHGAVREQVVLFSYNLRVPCHRRGATELGQSLAVVRGQNSHKWKNRTGIDPARKGGWGSRGKYAVRKRTW